MVASSEVSASPNGTQWQPIDWKAIESHVLKLQMRIAKATREGNHSKAKALQWILTHSRSAKLLAVKRVSQNKGSNTPVSWFASLEIVIAWPTALFNGLPFF